MTPEGKIKLKVRLLLEGYQHYRFMPVQMGLGTRTLDFLVCFKGKFVAIETKAPGNVTTHQQDAIIRDIEAAGGKVFVIDGDDGISKLHKWLDTNS